MSHATLGFEIRGKRRSDGFEEVVDSVQPLYDEVEMKFWYGTRKVRNYDASASRIYAANMASKHYNICTQKCEASQYTDIMIYEEYDKFDDASGFILIWKNGKWL